MVQKPPWSPIICSSIVYDHSHSGGMACAYNLAKPKHDMNTNFESTYGLVVRSQEKSRNILEILVYAIFILSVVAMILQFAQTPAKISAPGLEPRIANHASAANLPAES